jgi:hypothetical protein
MTETELNAAKASYDAGEALVRVAKQHQISADKMRALLVEAGVTIRGRREAQRMQFELHRKNAPERVARRDAIIADYQSGMRLEEIYKKYTTTMQQVYYFLKEVGLRPRRVEQYLKLYEPKTEREIVQRYVSGETIQTLSRELKVDSRRLRDLVKSAGVFRDRRNEI